MSTKIPTFCENQERYATTPIIGDSNNGFMAATEISKFYVLKPGNKSAESGALKAIFQCLISSDNFLKTAEEKSHWPKLQDISC